MQRLQHFTTSCGTEVAFIDMKESQHSAKCQPRDIRVIDGEDSPKVREEIAIDVRIGQGCNPVGVAKGLRHE